MLGHLVLWVWVPSGQSLPHGVDSANLSNGTRCMWAAAFEVGKALRAAPGRPAPGPDPLWPVSRRLLASINARSVHCVCQACREQNMGFLPFCSSLARGGGGKRKESTSLGEKFEREEEAGGGGESREGPGQRRRQIQKTRRHKGAVHLAGQEGRRPWQREQHMQRP